MTKKSGFILFVLIVLTIGILWFGQDYQNKQKLELLETNGSSQSNEDKSKDGEPTVTKKESFEKNRDKKSLLDYLSNVPTDNEKKVISFYGDFSESDNWLLSVEEYINDQVKDDVQFNTIALPDFDSYRLLEENTALSLSEANPDVVFFHIPVYGDQVRDISLSDSKEYMMKDYEAIKEALPETLVVFVTPNPSSSRKEEYNSRTLVYTSYLQEAIEMINDAKLPLFDLHEAYLAEVESTNLDLETTLTEDGKTLNNKGNEIYTTLFNNALAIPVDTTSGK
ncbi:MAG: SGNH/GDSL hydrolase family protein [Carnobacterium sp.]|uniref:hypothetical protein n=1 Tax=Carnobacterium sp. TaxID=48221 RepID=UPI003C75C35A